MVIPTKKENPEGLHEKYAIFHKQTGNPVRPAPRFILNLDDLDDPGFAHACRMAAKEFAKRAPSHLKKVGEELTRLCEAIEQR